MSYFVVDVEADGEIPPKYSMISFGAVIVEPALSRTFRGRLKPISKLYKPEMLKISGFSREDCMKFEDPQCVMEKFDEWIVSQSTNRPIFISDNLAFDWSWINWYFHWFLGKNPFGYSGRRIGDLYSGMVNDASKSQEWKKYRRTPHTHDPVEDALGNAEALLELKEIGLKITFE